MKRSSSFGRRVQSHGSGLIKNSIYQLHKNVRVFAFAGRFCASTVLPVRYKCTGNGRFDFAGLPAKIKSRIFHRPAQEKLPSKRFLGWVEKNSGPFFE